MFLMLHCMTFLYILDVDPLSEILFADVNIFSIQQVAFSFC